MRERPVPSSRTIVRCWLVRRDANEIQELKDFVHQCSWPSFDRWTSVARLTLNNKIITRDFLNVLMDFLNLPFAKDPTGGSADEEVRWIYIGMSQCRFAVDNADPHANRGDYCTLDEINDFLSTLADRTVGLSFQNCHQIMSYFLTAPRIELLGAVESLSITQGESISNVEYARLGNMIAGSVHLSRLELCLPFDDRARELFEGVANAGNIQELFLHDRGGFAVTPPRPFIEDFDPLIRLLQNQQNQLKSLRVVGSGLKDENLLAITRLLPTSRVEFISFSAEWMQPDGILELVRQLPKMLSLKGIGLETMPRCSESLHHAIGAALLRSVLEHTSIEYVDCLYRIPQGRLLWYYLVLNHAGRQILTSTQPIPDGLWPLVLERAGCRDIYSNIVLPIDLRQTTGTVEYQAMFFLLQNILPKLLSNPCVLPCRWGQ